MNPLVRGLQLLALAALGGPLSSLSAQQPIGVVPAEIRATADSFLRATLGDSLVLTSVRPRPEWSLYAAMTPNSCGPRGPMYSCGWPWFTSYFVLFYEFDPMHDPNRTGLIVVPIDTAANLIPEFPPAGAPDCRLDPGRCRFTITRDSAVAVARRAGMQGADSALDLKFVWFGRPFIGKCERCSRHFTWLGPEGIASYGWQVQASIRAGLLHELWIDAVTGTVVGDFGVGTNE